jgi:hypothetical protein
MTSQDTSALTPQDIEQVEHALLDGFHREVAPAAEGMAAAMIVGVHPDTVIRVVATAQGEERSHDWSIWDGTVLDGPLVPGDSVAQFLQALEPRIIEWLAAAYWRWPS